MDAPKLEGRKIPELKEICKSEGLPTSGKKQDLINRIKAARNAKAGALQNETHLPRTTTTTTTASTTSTSTSTNTIPPNELVTLHSILNKVLYKKKPAHAHAPDSTTRRPPIDDFSSIVDASVSLSSSRSSGTIGGCGERESEPKPELLFRSQDLAMVEQQQQQLCVPAHPPDVGADSAHIVDGAAASPLRGRGREDECCGGDEVGRSQELRELSPQSRELAESLFTRLDARIRGVPLRPPTEPCRSAALARDSEVFVTDAPLEEKDMAKEPEQRKVEDEGVIFIKNVPNEENPSSPTPTSVISVQSSSRPYSEPHRDEVGSMRDGCTPHDIEEDNARSSACGSGQRAPEAQHEGVLCPPPLAAHMCTHPAALISAPSSALCAPHVPPTGGGGIMNDESIISSCNLPLPPSLPLVTSSPSCPGNLLTPSRHVSFMRSSSAIGGGPHIPLSPRTRAAQTPPRTPGSHNISSFYTPLDLNGTRKRRRLAAMQEASPTGRKKQTLSVAFPAFESPLQPCTSTRASPNPRNSSPLLRHDGINMNDGNGSFSRENEPAANDGLPDDDLPDGISNSNGNAQQQQHGENGIEQRVHTNSSLDDISSMRGERGSTISTGAYVESTNDDAIPGLASPAGGRKSEIGADGVVVPILGLKPDGVSRKSPIRGRIRPLLTDSHARASRLRVTFSSSVYDPSRRTSFSRSSQPNGLTQRVKAHALQVDPQHPPPMQAINYGARRNHVQERAGSPIVAGPHHWQRGSQEVIGPLFVRTHVEPTPPDVFARLWIG